MRIFVTLALLQMVIAWSMGAHKSFDTWIPWLGPYRKQLCFIIKADIIEFQKEIVSPMMKPRSLLSNGISFRSSHYHTQTGKPFLGQCHQRRCHTRSIPECAVAESGCFIFQPHYLSLQQPACYTTNVPL